MYQTDQAVKLTRRVALLTKAPKKHALQVEAGAIGYSAGVLVRNVQLATMSYQTRWHIKSFWAKRKRIEVVLRQAVAK